MQVTEKDLQKLQFLSEWCYCIADFDNDDGVYANFYEEDDNLHLENIENCMGEKLNLPNSIVIKIIDFARNSQEWIDYICQDESDTITDWEQFDGIHY